MFSDVVILDGRAHLVTDALFAPLPAWYVRAAAQDGVIAAVAQAGTGTCQVVDSLGHRWDSGDVAFGVNCVGIRPHPQGWEVVWMRAPIGATYGRIVLDRDLVPVSPAMQQFASPYGNTSQGFLDLDASGVPIMTDQHRTVVCGPVTIGLPTTRGDWTIGQDWNGNRIVAWRAPTQRAFEVWRGGTQTCSHLAIEADGTAVVAIANTSILVPSTAFVPWTPWQEPDEPPAIVPTFAVPQHRVTLYVFDEPGAYDANGDFVARDGRPPLAFCDVTKSGAADLIAAARARHAGVLAYADDATYDVSRLPAGDDVIAAQQIYPHRDQPPLTGALRPLADQQALISASLDALEARRVPLAAVLGEYRQIYTVSPPTYNWPLQMTLDQLEWGWQQICARRIPIALIFVYRRGQDAQGVWRDGVVSRPEFGEALGRIRAAIAAAPHEQAPTPAPTPPPDPAPQPAPDPPQGPPAEARTETVWIGNQQMLVTPTEAAQIRAAQQAAVAAFNPALPIKDKP